MQQVQMCSEGDRAASILHHYVVESMRADSCMVADWTSVEVFLNAEC